MARDDGGSAFPGGGDEWIDHPAHGRIRRSESGEFPDPGMTLRDWFAGQVASSIAMPLLSASPESLEQAARNDGFSGTVDQYIAYRSGKIADAMIVERERSK